MLTMRTDGNQSLCQFDSNTQALISSDKITLSTLNELTGEEELDLNDFFITQLILINKLSVDRFRSLSGQDKLDLKRPGIAKLVLKDKLSIERFLSLSGEDVSDLAKFSDVFQERSVTVMEDFLNLHGEGRRDFIDRLRA